MSQSVIAKRYAVALFEAAQEKQQTLSVQADLKELQKVFADEKQFDELLISPKFSIEKKKELIGQLFNGANQLVLNTLYVLIDAGRIEEIGNLIEDFQELANEASGVAEAKVYSTRLLSVEESTAISTAFAHKVGKQSLHIENIIDPSLIGGIRLQIGNQIYDSSVSAKLARLERQLIN
ncbi:MULTISPECIES: F0F1 ATP synthase subunit delta [unclassified Sporosarcina]|uniref:F0F1 ATP synthase subunit delta n=1 Tax=unclassified Sporosarcina TaxID=2647733 RepID=UPI000C172B30|nr:MULTISPECIES: F0F1 ATP synthase subunit delta [unclassified Sporosarcina]PID15153.1 F0F1 ATP synthase subunit delta [Sporosarcina sp. P34]PID23907.1 F0F1 ATP synthase subunit delta [Sporosarcina sp. P7]